MVTTNSSPPLPLPVNVPPGHMVQQILDQNGTLQHVILSSDPITGAPAVPPAGTPQGPGSFAPPPGANQSGGASGQPVAAPSSNTPAPLAFVSVSTW